jgi:trehalose utilization protein
MRITVWNEFLHEQRNPKVAALYPEGIHGAIAEGLRGRLPHAILRTATLEQPLHGIADDVLDATDVLFWWGHLAHHRVDDARVEQVYARVMAGMGLIVLHSGHLSKVFRRLMGTSCNLRWREADDRELVWTVAPTHPIAADVPHPIVLPRHEMYGEFFDIPAPDELVFLSAFSGGEVFRSGCCFRRGQGRVFYFSPGHETYPIYHDPVIQRVLGNAALWAAPAGVGRVDNTQSIESPTDWFLPG